MLKPIRNAQNQILKQKLGKMMNKSYLDDALWKVDDLCLLSPPET